MEANDLINSPFSPEAMRKRFWDLQELKKKLTATALREQRDLHVNQAREIENELNRQIKEHEEGLAEVDKQLAIIARALGNFVGSMQAEGVVVGAEPVEPVPSDLQVNPTV